MNIISLPIMRDDLFRYKVHEDFSDIIIIIIILVNSK